MTSFIQRTKLPESEDLSVGKPIFTDSQGFNFFSFFFPFGPHLRSLTGPFLLFFSFLRPILLWKPYFYPFRAFSVLWFFSDFGDFSILGDFWPFKPTPWYWYSMPLDSSTWHPKNADFSTFLVKIAFLGKFRTIDRLWWSLVAPWWSLMMWW